MVTETEFIQVTRQNPEQEGTTKNGNVDAARIPPWAWDPIEVNLDYISPIGAKQTLRSDGMFESHGRLANSIRYGIKDGKSVGNLEDELDHSFNKPIQVLHRAMQAVMTDKSSSATQDFEASTSQGRNQARRKELGENQEDFQDTTNEKESRILSVKAMERLTLPATRLLHGLSRGVEDQAVPFMIVTGERSSPCITPEGSNTMMKTYKNKVDYCNLHGCKVWYALEVWEKGFVGTWVRCPLLLRLMKTNPSVPWFMWMDSDAIFTDFNFSIPFGTYNSWSKNLVVPGFWEKIYSETPDWMALNAGIFLIRNCEWSYTFLEKWSEFGAPENLIKSKKALNSVLKSRPQDWDPDDQSALVYLLSQNRTESEQNTFLEASYSLHGYWDYIVDKFEDILEGKEKWPFVTHFCGCNFCGGVDISHRCSKGFNRAFNFADNQLLALVGLRHSNLSTSSLQPISSS
eukprot:Gb_16800 [translate_table: standard]